MPHDIGAFVHPHLARIFPQLADVPIEYAWGGTLAISPNRLPFVIEPHPGLYAANGFSGVGVVLAPWLGDAVGRAMAGEAKTSECKRLTSPRSCSFSCSSCRVATARLTTVSYGKERPVALGSDEAAWAKNRRAVTITLN